MDPIEDLGALTGFELFARRQAAEAAIAQGIGKLVFQYSRLISALHLCVAWHDEGKGLDSYGDTASDLAAWELLNRIERQARAKLAEEPAALKLYLAWLRRVHAVRTFRNLLMHSRLGIESYGRYAIATSTIFVEPPTTTNITVEDLEAQCDACDKLMSDLSKLRREHPL